MPVAKRCLILLIFFDLITGEQKMTEKYIMSENNIPDGILHDQDLYNVSYNDNVLTLSFETHFYPQDYTDTTFAEKYKDFTKCHIKCRLEDKYFCDVHLETALDKNNNYKGKIISVEEFTEIANKEKKNEMRKIIGPGNMAIRMFLRT